MNAVPHRDGSHDISRLFDHLMSEGEVNMALRLLGEDFKGGVLSLDSGADSSGNYFFVLLEKY